MNCMSNIIQFNGIKAIIIREFIVFVREKERLVSSIISPILFLFVIGKSLNNDYQIGPYNYQQYIFAGIIAMNVLFTTIRYGLYLIWDKRLDFLKEVLVSPISRTSLFIGKALGGVIGATIEMIIILILGNVFVINLSLTQNLLIVLVSFVSGMLTVSIGLIIGAVMKTMEGFGLVMSFVTWPMFLLSNALFDIKSTSNIIKKLSLLNPFTYFVDLLRYISIKYSLYSPLKSLSLILIWIAILFIIGIKTFEKMDIQK
ncbi:MAG: ABC transporter permease [Elusimicrobiales bacterium]|nr:ABC transporter permease [Elusimicrobiales bacterium]